MERRTITARWVQSEVHGLHRVSEQTIRRHLREAELRSRAQVPRLTLAHRRARLQFACNHVNWTVRQWRNVYFSDESRFCLYGNDARIRTWRRQREYYDQRCIMPIRAHNGGSVMVWRCISLSGRTDLIILPPPAMTSIRHVNDVLQPHILPLKRQLRQNFVFM